jgi:hypothetical protein
MDAGVIGKKSHGGVWTARIIGGLSTVPVTVHRF